jgi:hypothetical protein
LAFAHNIQPWALDYLNEHPDLLVSSWKSSKGQNLGLMPNSEGQMLRYISTIVLCVVASAGVGAEKENNCSDAVEQISSAVKYVGSSNYVFELKRERSVNVLLFLQKPMPGSERARWRLIERPIESLG